MYGKARVGNGVLGLAHSLGIDVRSVDDADAGFRASDYTAIIPTPGVNPTNRAYEAGNILSELDFAYRYLPSGFTIIAVTGTDGKSTTAWIIYELLRKEYCKDQVFLSGNFEIPFSETVLDIRKRGLTTGYIVLEVSSFMAYGI